MKSIRLSGVDIEVSPSNVFELAAKSVSALYEVVLPEYNLLKAERVRLAQLYMEIGALYDEWNRANMGKQAFAKHMGVKLEEVHAILGYERKGV